MCGGVSGDIGLIPSMKSLGMPIRTMIKNGASRITMNSTEESPTIFAPRRFTAREDHDHGQRRSTSAGRTRPDRW